MQKIRVGDRLLDRWEVLSVHPGGMGVVYILRDGEGNLAAAKTVRDDLAEEARFVRRFAQEVRTWVALGRHPNLVEARGTFEVEGRPFLLLEFVRGKTLAELLAAGGPLLPAEALDYLLGLCRGMEHAESSTVGPGGRGIVHRDLKPSNLFVTPERRALVSDFGMAKSFVGEGSLTDEGMGLGTPYYVSPEQLRDARTTDGRGDVYSSGAILYEALTGEPPLKAETIENQVYNILRVVPPSPDAVNPLVPRAVAALALRCLEKDREKRFPNFAALAEAAAGALRLEAARPLPPGTALCASCGHAQVRPAAACPLDGGELRPAGPGDRYGPVERTDPASLPELSEPLRVRVDGVEVRPRVPRTGQPMTVTVLLANPGVETVKGCVVPFILPDPEAFLRRGTADFWRGDVAPTAAGAPRRASWEAVPLREGAFEIPPPRVLWRDRDGSRREARGEAPFPFQVEAHAILPLVGRAAETATEREAVEAALARRPFAVLFLGGPGTGKTRLLDELAATAADRGFRVMRGRGLERAGQALRSLHEALAGYFGVDDPSLRREEITARVVDGLDPLFGRDPELVAFLSAFLAGGAPRDGAGDFHWQRFFGGAVRREPLALLLDDVHYGEFETMDLAAALALRAREEGWPLLLAMASRPDDPDARAALRIRHLLGVRQRLEAEGAIRVHGLGALGAADVARLLDAAFPGNAFEAEAPFLAGALAEQTGGNPFFLAETFQLLRSARGPDGEPLLAQAPGGWSVSPSLTPESLRELVPDAVEDAAEGHLRTLSVPALEVLEHAAVIGEEFEADLLAEVAGGAGPVDRALEEMERAGIAEAVDEGLARYRFTHSILPHVLERRVGEASPRRLRRLHGAVADALVRLHGKRGARVLGLRLSRHLLHAGRNREAFEALVTASGRLVRAQLFPRAASTLAHAQELLDGGLRPPRHLLRDFHFNRGETARILGRYDEALQAFQAAIEIASASGRRVDRQLLATAYSKMGKVYEARGQLTDALYCYGVGMGLREEEEDRTGLASSLVNIGTAYALSGDRKRAREQLMKALDLSREARNRSARANAKTQLGGLDLAEGNLAAARRWYRRGLALFRSMRDQRGQAAALNGLGNVALGRGDPLRAERAYARSLELRRTIGDREGMANSYNNLGIVAERRRDFPGAVALYRKSLSLHRSFGSRRGIAGAAQNLGEALLRAGDHRASAESLRASTEAWRGLGDREHLVAALLVLARALEKGGDGPGAERSREEAAEEARSSGSAAARSAALAAKAEVLVREKRGREALALLDGATVEGLPPEVEAEVRLVVLGALLDGSSDDARIDTALEAAGDSVGKALVSGGDPDLAVRLGLLRARRAEARGDRLGSAEAFREAVASAGTEGRIPDGLLVEALRGLSRTAPDPAEADRARARAREAGEEIRARAGTEFARETDPLTNS
jgi:tetratricopeptide (TPR) repeat protein